MSRDSMIFYRSFYESLNGLSPMIKAEVYDAIFEYGINFKEIEFENEFAKALFTLIKPQLDANIKRYNNGIKPKSKAEAKDKQEITKTEPKDIQTSIKTETNVNVNENVNVNAPSFDFAKALSNYGFDELLIKEWLKIRKSKKAVNSEIAYNGFIREIEKSPHDKNEIMKICIEKSWKGFEASWLSNSVYIKPQTTETDEFAEHLLRQHERNTRSRN